MVTLQLNKVTGSAVGPRIAGKTRNWADSLERFVLNPSLVECSFGSKKLIDFVC